jgi:molybdate transport system ATP-binding protein
VRAQLRSHLDQFTGPVLVITHDPLEAMIMADRLLVIENGRIVQQGTPAQVVAQPATQYVARLVGLNLYPAPLS